MMSAFFAVLSLSASTDGEAFKPPAFDRYQPILDRMPFGALPENFSLNPQDVVANQLAAKAQAEQEVLKKKVKMSVVNITPAGATAIGFTDMSVNPPVNHYVKVGDKSGDWTVLSADYSKGVAVIEKDGVSVDLSLQEAVASAAAENEKTKDDPNAIRITRRARAGSSGRPLAKWGRAGITVPAPEAPAQQQQAAVPGKPDAVSYAERLRERDARKTQEKLAAEAKMREQFEKLARETAAKEIQRREEEALAAQEAAEQQQWAEQQQPQAAEEAAPAVIQEGNLE